MSLATAVYYGAPWRDDDLLARAIVEAKAAEHHHGIRRHFEIGWDEVAATNPLYGQHAQSEIARLGEHHPIIQSQYLLRALARAGRFLFPDQLAALIGDHLPEPFPLGPGPDVAAIDVAGADEEDPEGQLTRINPLRDSTVLLIARVEETRVASDVLPSPGALAYPSAAAGSFAERHEQAGALSLTRGGPKGGAPSLGWERAGGRVSVPTDRTPAAELQRPPGQPLPTSSLRPAWAVLEPHLRIVHARAWTGVPHRQIYPEILDLVRTVWRCRSVVVDETGVGGGLAAFLGAALGPRIVTPYVYTAKTKSDLAYGLLEALNSRRLTLYADSADPVANDARRELLRQASAAEYELRAHQAMIFFVPEYRGHDDHLNALALLVQASHVAAHRFADGHTSPRHRDLS